MTDGEFVAAIDQGTTSTRCLFFDASSRLAGSSQREHRQILPRPGWVEHDAREILCNTLEVAREAERSLASGARISALGVTNQRETIVIWNRETGEPYANAIVWQDTRTHAAIEAQVREHGIDRFRDVTGLPLATYFSASKIAWALENVTGLRDEARAGRAICGTIDSWLVWNLTGGTDGGAHVTDVTNASRTQLMNLVKLEWEDEILDAFNIPRSMLPRIVPTCERDGWGVTRPGVPFETSVPVCAAVGDQQGALIGQGCFDAGDAKNTYGTGCFLLLNTGTEPVQSNAGLLTTLAYQLPGRPVHYALEGSVAVAGSLVQWLRDNLGIIERAEDVESLARSVDDSGGIYLVPAFSGLFAPYWRPDARGVLVGLTRFVNKAHIARAALEATCHQTRDVLDAMKLDAKIDFAELKVDGGMVVNELLMQLQADVLGFPVVRPENLETTSLGAAYAAGLAVDFFPSIENLETEWRAAGRWTPQARDDERAIARAGWKKAIERSLNWM